MAYWQEVGSLTFNDVAQHDCSCLQWHTEGVTMHLCEMAVDESLVEVDQLMVPTIGMRHSHEWTVLVGEIQAVLRPDG